MKQRISLRDIATATGFSVFTVSLALREDTRIKAETRAFIQHTANNMGYVKDPHLSAVMSRNRGKRPGHIQPELALIFLDPMAQVVNVAPFRSFLSHLEESADERGYHLERFDPYGGGPGFKQINRILRARNIRGVLMTSSAQPTATEDLKRIDWRNLCPVFSGITLPHPPAHRVDRDYIESLLMAWNHARGSGHTRIGVSIPLAIEQYAGNRYRMAVDFCQNALPRKQRLPMYEEADWNQHRFRRWIRDQRPDVIISTDPHLIVEIRKAGHRVPEDIGFICLHLHEEDSELTGTLLPHHERTDALVDTVNSLLQNQLQGITDYPRLTFLKPKWHRGQTLRKA